MKIIVDAFGGDNAPVAVLKGCELALQEYTGIEIALVGDTDKIKQASMQNSINISGMQICQTDEVIEIEDDPLEIRKSKANSSMGLGLKMLAEGAGDAFVSAGSTGALVVGSSFIVKRIKGIKRAALAPIMPTDNGCFMLMDGGANLDCRPEMLMQFGIMGSIYVNRILGVDSPRIALANVGAEETKGTELQLAAYELLKNLPLNFTGNVEARDIPFGVCDVVVADGFTGNTILKMMEGMGAFINKSLKEMFGSSVKTKAAALLVMNQLKAFKKKMDYTEYGGAPLMGISKPVIKAHGSSNANAFKNAIRQAKDFVEKGVIAEITESIQNTSTN